MASVEQLRSRLIAGGTDPEAVNDMVMALGAHAFTLHFGAVLDATARAEATIASGPGAAMCSAFERELLMRLLCSDPASPTEFNDAVETIHHLIDHGVETGCALAVVLRDHDPLRIVQPPSD